MFNTRRAKFLFYFLLAISVLLPIYLYPQLPDRIASHFNINGNADGWMNKRSYLLIHYGIIFILTVVFNGMAVLMPKMPHVLYNIPNKTYWLSDQMKKKTVSILQGMLYWIGSLCLLLFLYVFYQVYKANITGSGRMDSFSWFGIIIFLMANGIILMKYLSYFNQKDNY